MNLLWGCSFFFYAAYLTRVLCLRDLEMFRSQPLRSYSIYSHSPERVKWKWFVAPYVWYRKSQFVVEFWRLKNSKRSDGPKKDFDDPVGQFVVEFWRLKSRKRSDDPWQVMAEIMMQTEESQCQLCCEDAQNIWWDRAWWVMCVICFTICFTWVMCVICFTNIGGIFRGNSF